MSQPPSPPEQSIFRFAELNQQRPTRFDIRPDANRCSQLATDLGFHALRKLRFSGKLTASGKKSWTLIAKLGATIEQDCIVTLQPVVTRLDCDVRRQFVPAGDFLPEEEQAEEVEMHSDETLEPIPDEIDLYTVLHEALAIEAPDYPRSSGAALDTAVFSEPGVAPMTDSDAKPFAELAKLKDKMQKET